MHRHIVYPGQIPLDTDMLHAQKNALVGLAWLAVTTLGSNTVVDGFSVAPTTPASMAVTVGPGAIYSTQPTDTVAYGSLGTDANSIVKQGLLQTAATLTITAPGTVGYAQNYLLQVGFSEIDGVPVVLPYFNADAPDVGWAGPEGEGASQPTVRQSLAVLQLKAAAPATAGTQTTPTPDPGFVGIAVITVANGATTITSGNISMLSSAPFVYAKLPAIPAAVQSGTWIFCRDTSATPGVIVANLLPGLSALTPGMCIRVLLANNISGPTQFNPSGLGLVPCVHKGGGAFAYCDYLAGDTIDLVYDGTRLVSETPINNAIIDAALIFTAHGTNCDFADLLVFTQWLSRRRISHNGSVTVNIAAGRFVYTQRGLIDHPDAARLTIAGATLLAAAPTIATFSVTGNDPSHRATDTANQLAALRGIYATELHFSGGCDGLATFTQGVTFQNVLLTGDGTSAGGQGNGIFGLGAFLPLNVSIHGFGASSIRLFSSTPLEVPAGYCLTASGSVEPGFSLAEGASIIHGGTLISVSHGASAFALSGGQILSSGGVCYARGRAGDAASVQAGSSFFPGAGSQLSACGGNGLNAYLATADVAGCTLSGNNGWGIVAQECSLNATGCGVNGNVLGPTFANNGAVIVFTGSSSTGSPSPAFNTPGNNGSIIYHWISNMLLYIRGPIVVATHTDDQTVAASVYGDGVSILSVPNGTALARYGDLPDHWRAGMPDTRPYAAPTTLAGDALAYAIQWECSSRINAKCDEIEQRNIFAYVLDLTNMAVSGTALTASQQADIGTARAIRQWIQNADATGMVGTCRALISAGDAGFQADAKWPAWDPSNRGWTAFVTRF